MLLCTAVILFLAYWVTRKIGLSSGVGECGRGQPDACFGQAANRDRPVLLVVQLGEQCFVLGVSKEHISLIAELTEEQAQLWKKSAAVHKADTAPAAFLRRFPAGCMEETIRIRGDKGHARRTDQCKWR